MSATKKKITGVRKSFLAVVFGFLLILVLFLAWLIRMPGTSFEGPIPALDSNQKQLSVNLEKHVKVLATEIGERNIGRRYAELTESANYIEGEFKNLGYPVRIQEYSVKGMPVRNIEAVKVGIEKADEIIVIGAHYDSAEGTPGANDNGSAVAAMIELARMLYDVQLNRTVRFVAFVNEEPPYFHTDDMGSLRYARSCRDRDDDIIAMMSLETIGFYSNEPGSQKYPPILKSFYPDKGNFIGFVGNIGSKSLVHKILRSFRKHASFPSEGASLPGSLTGVDWSDHWSFWQAGYQAVMVTDTAIFRYPHYHKPTDTPDKIDFPKTALVVDGLADVIAELAE